MEVNQYWRDYYQKNKGRYVAKNIAQLYGVTLVWYLAQCAHQLGLCAACKQPCRSGKKLSVDHNHNTGQIRGLLCLGCNLAIGNAQESPDTLRALADYLEA